jgi:hypothetical protein
MLEKNLKFIEKAKLIHGEKYDYSLVNYTESKNYVNIICKEHGIFNQRASAHLSGDGCKKCSYVKQRLGNKCFIEKAKLIHGDEYDYSLVNYINFNTNIKIICPTHGEFEQTPNNHLKGSRCEKCTFLNRRVGNKCFIEKAKLIHGEIYDYSKIKYITSHVKITIICPKHGEFIQTPHNHLKGVGCPICKESKGENNIRLLLLENNIKFIPQHKFNECRNKLPLPFDFYLPDYNTCIEFNGIQHYKPIEFFGGEKYLIDVKLNDVIKKKYCDKNNINLIIIKYNEIPNKIISLLKKN